jgi:hypothetical protein
MKRFQWVMPAVMPQQSKIHIPCAFQMHMCVFTWPVNAEMMNYNEPHRSGPPASCPMLMSPLLLSPALILAGRSIGLTAAPMVVGILVGALLNSWLRVDIVPLGVSE